MPFRAFIYILLLAFCWGPSYLFIRFAVEEVEPLTIVCIRVTLGLLVLLGVMAVRRVSFPNDKLTWFHCTVMGLLSNSIPFFMFSYGEQYINSSLASIINGSVPMITVMLAHFLLHDEPLTPAKALGSITGFLGLLVLILPSMDGGEYSAKTVGLLAIVTACTCYAIGMVYARKFMRGVDPLVASTTQLLTSILYMIPLCLMLESPLSIETLSTRAMIALCYLGIPGVALSFLLYYKTAREYGASTVATVGFLLPIVGTILGVVAGNETLQWNFYLAFGLIFSGMFLVNSRAVLKRRVA